MSYRTDVIDPGDAISKLAHKVCLASYGNSPAVRVVPRKDGRFRGTVSFRWAKHVLQDMLDEKVSETLQNDGAGGKPAFYTLVGTPEAMRPAIAEIIRMTAEDIAVCGGLPCVITSHIDFKGLKKNFELAEALVEGQHELLKEAGLVLITGETAVMKFSITAFCDTGSEEQLIFTWSGDCLGLMPDGYEIDGSQIGPNMPIVAFLEEQGFRCNGGTKLADIARYTWSRDIEWMRRNPEAMDFAREAATPSRGCAKTISRLHGWTPDGRFRPEGRALARFAGVAHNTGGGLGKFFEILPKGVGADVDNAPELPRLITSAHELSQAMPEPMRERDLYDTFNGGMAVVAVLFDEDDIEVVKREAALDGIKVQHVGYTVTDSSRTVWIKSPLSGTKMRFPEMP